MRMFWMCASSGASSGSMNSASERVFMIIGSPPVIRTSVTSGCVQVGHQLGAFAGVELHVVHADELRPAEAEGAVGVAGLARAREEQHRFLVLVLQAFQGRVVHARDVVGHLAGRVRIHAHADLVHQLGDGGGILLVQHQVAQLLVFAAGQHVAVREGQAVDRIVGDAVPVDQLLHHVFVGAETAAHGRPPAPLPAGRDSSIATGAHGDRLAGIGLELRWRRFGGGHGVLQTERW
jgi:hypothetical protein